MEEWRDISGYEGIYKVSDYGKVKRMPHTVTYKNGAKHHYKERMLHPVKQNTGYLTVTLCFEGENKTVGVHRLVAEAFIRNPYKKNQVKHIDGCKTNNELSNLEWCTEKENSIHAWEIGLNRITDKHRESASKQGKKRSKAIECIDTGEIFTSARDAERKLGILNQNISKV